MTALSVLALVLAVMSIVVAATAARSGHSQAEKLDKLQARINAHSAMLADQAESLCLADEDLRRAHERIDGCAKARRRKPKAETPSKSSPAGERVAND